MERQALIEKLKSQGYASDIVDAFAQVDRAAFVPHAYHDSAYDDTALPIASGQTISQPQTIAFMLSLLRPQGAMKILEVGSGCGYVLALLTILAPEAEIYGTERHKELVLESRSRLSEAVHIYHTPDTLGLSEHTPFDRILVSAAAKETVPDILLSQLAAGGILICPVDNKIVSVEKKKDGSREENEYPGFAFVPLLTSGK